MRKLMVKELLTVCGLAAVVFIFLSFSCKHPDPGPDPGTPDHGPYPLPGRVVESIGGGPVPEAVVQIKDTAYTTLTDYNGFFRFEKIHCGVYEVNVSKAGRAGSKLENVQVAADQPALVIVLPIYSYDVLAVIPPSITINGIESNKEYSGMIPLEITVAPGSCPVIGTDFHRSIYLKIGTTAMSYYEEAESRTAALSYLWNTTLLPPGKANIKVVAYDNNNNRSELNLPVNIAATPGKVPGVVPLEEYYSIIATTYGRSMDFTRANTRSLFFPGQTLPDSRVPLNSTITVEFSVQKYYSGIVIYKSLSQDGVFTLTGQASGSDGGSFKFMDYDPTLEPGITVFYKLAYFNQYGIGAFTAPISVRILPQYNLSLVSPPNNGFITEITPTLTWTCTPFLDVQRTDWIIVRNVLDTTIIAYSFLINKNEFTLPELLYNNKYEWDVRSYYEYVNSTGTANVLSRSFPGGRSASDFSLNGAFYFTLIQQE